MIVKHVEHLGWVRPGDRTRMYLRFTDGTYSAHFFESDLVAARRKNEDVWNGSIGVLDCAVIVDADSYGRLIEFRPKGPARGVLTEEGELFCSECVGSRRVRSFHRFVSSWEPFANECCYRCGQVLAESSSAPPRSA